MLPKSLRSEQAERLAQTLAGDLDQGDESRQGRAGNEPRTPSVRLQRAARRVARKLARPLVRPIIERAAEPGQELGRLALERIDALDRSLSSIRADATEWEMERGDLRIGLVNQGLLKSEVRALEAVLDQLGRAIAPAFGLSEAATALAELRERVTECERRLRYAESHASTGVEPGPAGPGGHQRDPAPAGPGGSVSTWFDYSGFERRFRGRPEDIVAILDERYGALLTAHPPVLDLGCGRAELVGLLGQRGVAAMGVDTDPAMVADACERGLNVVQADAVDFLRRQAPGAFGAIVATHVLEHLELDSLLELLELSRTRLAPGGILIAETPNPTSLIVLGNSYILDPTHVRPLHPKLLEFLCEGAGFRKIEVRFFAPATGYRIEMITDPDAPPWTTQINQAFEHLNDILFGPQDFAILATTPDHADPGSDTP